MAKTAAGRSAAAPKPIPQARQFQQQQQQQKLIQMGVVAGIIAAIVVPRLPSPVFGVDWKGYLWNALKPSLGFPMPPPQAGLPIPSVPVAQIVLWGIAVFLVLVVFGLIQHLISLYMQRTRPLSVERTYVQIRTPLTLKMEPTDSLNINRSLHGLLPPGNMVRGDPAPMVLRLTARPEQSIVQGVSLAGGKVFIESVINTLKGAGAGSRAEVKADPLLKELKEGRFIGWSDVRLAAGDDLPIAVAGGSEVPVMKALVSALPPQTGVNATDLQMILRPAGDRNWRMRVLARLESLKVDAGTAERRAMEAKAAGPAYDVALRLVAVGESPQAVQAMVQTMSGALSASAQGIAFAQQRLVAGPPIVLPAVLPTPPPVPRTFTVIGAGIGAVLAILVGLLLWLLAGAALPWYAWAIPLLALPIPALSLAAWHRKRVQANLPMLLRQVVVAATPPRNPKLVPLISDWLGR